MFKQRSIVILMAILFAIIIIVAFMILIHLGSPSDIVMAPGVKAGDEFTYELKGFWNS